MSFTPLIDDTILLFLHFPPPLVVRFFLPTLSSLWNPTSLVALLRVMMTVLLITTAPFGDCHSLKELCRPVRQLKFDGEGSSPESITSTGCECLEWLNIPTGFGSALAHSNTRVAFDHYQTQLRQHIPTARSFEIPHFTPTMLRFLPDEVNITRDTIFKIGGLTRDLNQQKAHSIVFETEMMTVLGKMIFRNVRLVRVREEACVCGQCWDCDGDGALWNFGRCGSSSVGIIVFGGL
ncbi:hypothetical protein BLNAU_11137 [Blattamonas nauphoetae]|uniref:Uncharacterized protein n=1 Tax=Blattamonas nauphoetae TaxID=2049346 RepID=A0ABQ9XSD5_9EUKA|nr:hypothetical protein BLNAU_11137 [Blattamonas nauphoetae]